MTYVVIEDDPAATFRIVPDAPTIALVEKEVREMGWARVYLPRTLQVVGWVFDVGHVMDGFRRNVVASCVMAVLTARPQPLAGPLVLTGYAYDEGSWPEDLGGPHLTMVARAYLGVLHALGMPLPEHLAEHHSSVRRVMDDHWVAAVRDTASVLGQAPAPTMTMTGPLGQHLHPCPALDDDCLHRRRLCPVCAAAGRAFAEGQR